MLVDSLLFGEKRGASFIQIVVSLEEAVEPVNVDLLVRLGKDSDSSDESEHADEALGLILVRGVLLG